jgi:hypothetical protein
LSLLLSRKGTPLAPESGKQEIASIVPFESGLKAKGNKEDNDLAF